MAEPTEPTRYHIYLDYKGYQIDERSYRVFPAPLMGTRFATGRTAYSNMDFWQVGALTDFTKGINQKFLVDPSQCYKSVGIDVSKEGELRLERDLETQAFPSSVGIVTARYRSRSALWLGTSTGRILKSTNGTTFTTEQNTSTGQIYNFYEMGSYLYATKGKNRKCWRIRTFGNPSWEKLDGSGGKPDLEDLFFVMVESSYAYGMFGDGIRQSIDGVTWLPEPPDPLWELPASEGAALNALPIQRGFLIGASRGAWIFVGGASALNIWFFPEFANPENFKGMDKFGTFGIFGVEGLGIFFTDGSGIFPTNLNWQEEPIAITSCKSILTSGYDVFALVGDGNNWYLARCNMKNSKVPKYFWLVKQLTKTPAFLSTFSRTSVYIHYEDGTCQKYNKILGPYQASGYLITPLIDENLVLLQKLYKSIDAIYSAFPQDTTVKLAYRLSKDSGSFTEKSFTGGYNFNSSFNLANPTLSVRIQIKATLETTSTNYTPILTDLLWKYILERPIDETIRAKNFHFTILCEDELEKLDFDKEELGLQDPRSRENIVKDLWLARDKQKILNYVGADNVNYPAFVLRYVGSGSSCLMNIDRTNNQIVFKVDNVIDQTISYLDIKIEDLVATLAALDDYTCEKDPALPQAEMALDLFPVDEQEIKGGVDVYYGTDVHSVIFNTQAPAQYKGAIEGRGSDKINLSLRES